MLVPSGAMPAEIWSEQIADLSHDFYVIALDPRSQGASEQVTEGRYAERRARDLVELYIMRLTELSLRTPTNTVVLLLAHLVLMPVDWRTALQELQRPLVYVIRPQLKADAQVLRTLKPDARVEIFEDVGHALFVDAPQRFNSLIREVAAVSIAEPRVAMRKMAH